jgi:hypothetical protein
LLSARRTVSNCQRGRPPASSRDSWRTGHTRSRVPVGRISGNSRIRAPRIAVACDLPPLTASEDPDSVSQQSGREGSPQADDADGPRCSARAKPAGVLIALRCVTPRSSRVVRLTNAGPAPGRSLIRTRCVRTETRRSCHPAPRGNPFTHLRSRLAPEDEAFEILVVTGGLSSISESNQRSAGPRGRGRPGIRRTI